MIGAAQLADQGCRDLADSEPREAVAPAAECAPVPAKTCLGCGARQEPDGSLPCGH